MELEDFIGKTLVSIAKGVKLANKELGSNRFSIEPVSYYKDRQDGCLVFDVAVTAGSRGTTKGEAGIKIWAVAMGGGKEKSINNEIVSRIKFKISPNSLIS